MSHLLGSRFSLLAIPFVLIGCKDTPDPTVPRALSAASSTPSYTVGSGSTSKLLGRATFSGDGGQSFQVARTTGHWSMNLQSSPALDIAVQSIVFAPGSFSGWHSHPGPVFIQVVSGEMTFYESDDPNCTPIVKNKGESYLDMGDHAHIARNETDMQAETLVTYFAPPGADLRIDQPRPGNCHF
ncbi:MAG: hypothetical protein JWL95_2958 [Gemmatimonadetes bacterium]|nr:hypothetical protein [Gemmatimonadota bacterium]